MTPADLLAFEALNQSSRGDKETPDPAAAEAHTGEVRDAAAARGGERRGMTADPITARRVREPGRRTSYAVLGRIERAQSRFSPHDDDWRFILS